MLTAILHPPAHGERVLPYGESHWSLQINLAKQTPQPLWGERWSYAVTPALDGLHSSYWDHLQGLSDGIGSDPVGGEGFTVLRDDRVRSFVDSAMASEGLDAGALRWDQTLSFRYRGEQFPAVIRYYLDGGIPDRPDQIAVVYTHIEQRWGRDLSWSKLIRAKVDSPSNQTAHQDKGEEQP